MSLFTSGNFSPNKISIAGSPNKRSIKSPSIKGKPIFNSNFTENVIMVEDYNQKLLF